MVSYLDRYALEIHEPYDMVRLFSRIPRGKNHMVKCLRKLFKLCELLGYSEDWLDSLRKALPRAAYGVDVKIPQEEKIRDSLRRLSGIPQGYRAVYELLFDSGLRLVEAVELVNSFNEENLVSVNGFCRYELAMFRGSKQAYYAHFSNHTLEEIRRVKEKFKLASVQRFFCKYGFVRPKYIRKYAFDKMIELDIPESVADFIEGRVPRTIGAKHNMALARQSSNFYPRYLKHVEAVRNQFCPTL